MLLFDQNISPRLVDRLADIYPNSIHVDRLGLASVPDREVWDYAGQHNYLIVTKDADFSELSILLGFPPKVIWIRRGNCSTRDLEELLREKEAVIHVLAQSLDANHTITEPVPEMESMSDILHRIRSRPRVNPEEFGLRDSMVLIREDRDRL
ncbi:DUF5615 family PIN-like protein [Roseofilum reptotaenium CS-1145]|uniref:DUF5615 family PIN-like protein n=1 Tax=Roseofilum reptotaenium TaxID=1233427 RepID=UPI000A6593B8|nr:DUF5615 family PIN-like protein [Roseofilum reptotaenium]MDB9519411.1 DUF5615 family PIN-like protein [Roseofilum reptotaenium CS-1145]